MDDRKALDGAAYGLMLFMCMAMGLQSISVKVIGQDISPILQIGLRSAIAAFLVLFYMRLNGEDFTLVKSVWWPGLLSAVFFAVEYIFVGEALRFTTAARVTVFMYTAPLFSALILHFFKPSERLSGWQWGGVFITFGGIVTAFWEFSPPENTMMYPHMLFGDLLALIGGLLWALTTATLRLSRLQSTPGTVTLLYQLVLTAVLLPLTAAILGQMHVSLSNFVVFNMTYQTLIIAFGNMLLWLWLIRTYSATRIGILSFLTPIFTIVFAIMLLDEPVALHFIVGAVLVVSGLVIISLSKNVALPLQKSLK